MSLPFFRRVESANIIRTNNLLYLFYSSHLVCTTLRANGHPFSVARPQRSSSFILHLVGESEIQTLITFVGRRRQVNLLLFGAHGGPYLLSSTVLLSASDQSHHEIKTTYAFTLT